MPVYITDKDALDKMTLVEGDQWREDQYRFGICSFQAFLDEYLKFKEYLDTLSEEDRKEALEYDMGITVDSNAAIYGSGGWNRYFVRSNGEIVFSRGHSIEKDQHKARAVGFHVTGDPR